MRSRNSVFTSFKAFLCLFFFKSLWMEQLAEIDFQNELMSNKQLKESDSQAKEDMRGRIVQLTVKRARLLRKRLLLSFIWIISWAALSILLLWLLPWGRSRDVHASMVFGVCSLICFSVATLGRLGWEGQSFKGDTIFEQLDNRIFWLLYGFGAGLGTAAFMV